MSDTHKQVIVMRTDLGMRKGKMVAQGAHASLKALLDIAYDIDIKNYPVGDETIQGWAAIPLNDNTTPWLEGRFTKVCVGVDSEAGLLEIHEKAKAAGLLTSLIRDAGLTEFNGVPTLTCCAVGPGKVEEIDKITGQLKLL